MRVTKLICFLMAIMVIPALASAQQAPAASTPVVKHVAITNALASSGQAMYKSYCAVCHGADGKGEGPAAPALKARPTDLTLLAQKNSGKYPSAHVAAVIRGQAPLVSHGTQDMPVWGPLFSNISQSRQSEVQQRISNLVGYIESLQVK